METVLSEYKEGTHYAAIHCCSLCDLYYKMNCNCGVCPMTVFSGKDKFPCMRRRCIPLDCGWRKEYKYKVKLKAVVEFYQQAIAKVKILTEEELNQSQSFAFLIGIDNEIADKHELYLNKKSKIKPCKRSKEN